MSGGAEKPNAFQRITDHIKSLEQDMEKIDEQQKHLDKLLKNTQDDVYEKFDSLVSAIKKSCARAHGQLDELYQQEKRKLDDARQKLIDRKTKAETELIVDHRPVELPEVSLNCSVDIVNALQEIDLLKLSVESGRRALFTILLKNELKKECTSGAIGGFSFPGPSTSSNSGVNPVFAPLSIPATVVPPNNSETTRKRKKKVASSAADPESPRNPFPTLPPPPKKNLHTLRDFVRCINCHKPRCVYSCKKLAKDDKECWESLKGILPYRCGANLLFPTEPLTVEKTDCSIDVNNHFFSREGRFPAVCYKCGANISSSSSSRDSKQKHVENQSGMIIHDVCQICKDRGIEPRTEKKKPASKKANCDNQSDRS